MKANNYFQSKRADAGIANRAYEEIKSLPAGSNVSILSWEGLGNYAMEKYDSRVRAKLREMGMNVPESGPLTVDDIRATIREKSGLEIEELSADSVSRALDVQLSSELSNRLGITVTTVFDQEAMKAQVRAVVLEKLADGTAAGLLKGATLRAMRAKATFQRAGVSLEDEKKMLNRKYQKKYRRTHKQQWV